MYVCMYACMYVCIDMYLYICVHVVCSSENSEVAVTNMRTTHSIVLCNHDMYHIFWIGVTAAASGTKEIWPIFEVGWQPGCN